MLMGRTAGGPCSMSQAWGDTMRLGIIAAWPPPKGFAMRFLGIDIAPRGYPLVLGSALRDRGMSRTAILAGLLTPHPQVG